MRISRLAFLTALIFSLSACKKDDPVDPDPPVLDSNVTVNVKGMFGPEELVLDTYFTNIEGFEVQVEALRFYISDVYLTRDGEDDVLVSDLEILDFEENDVSRSYLMPAGDYTGFKYSIGVPVGSNGTADPDFNPAIFGPDHPLSIDNGMYWSWSSGYRFMVFEGRTDTLPSSTSDFPLGFSIHTGHDQFFKTFEVSESFQISDTEMTNLNIIMDVDRFMYNESDTLHFNTNEDTQLGGAITDLSFSFDEMLDGAISSEVE